MSEPKRARTLAPDAALARYDASCRERAGLVRAESAAYLAALVRARRSGYVLRTGPRGVVTAADIASGGAPVSACMVIDPSGAPGAGRTVASGLTWVEALASLQRVESAVPGGAS